MQPIIFHIPHSSTLIPPDVRKQMIVSDSALKEELRVLTDHHTHQLFAECAQESDELIVHPVSRLVVDVERFPDDAKEPMSAVGMGAVYLKGHNGTVLRTCLEDKDRLMREYYEPHHKALEQAVERQLSQYGCAIILDCHSFPERKMPCELDPNLYRPEICIGTDAFHTPKELASVLEETYLTAGYSTARNTPFAGAIVPMAFYGKEPRVHSAMIELRRDVYMNELSSHLLPDLNKVRSANVAAITAVRDFYNRSP